MTSYAILLLLHFTAVIVWVGGMAIMHFAVRPAAMETLEPAQRLPFMVATLERFFVAVIASIVVLIASGAWMIHIIASAGRLPHSGHAMLGLGIDIIASVGRLPHSVHAMLGLGIVMMAIFGHIRFAVFPRLRRAVSTQSWPEAASRLGTIRQMVALNLALGFLTVAVAIVGRTLLA